MNWKSEFSRIEWRRYSHKHVDAEAVARDIWALLQPDSFRSAEKAYRAFENRLWTQNSIPSVAEPAMRVFASSLSDQLDDATLVGVLECMFHILNAGPDGDDGTPKDIGHRVRIRAFPACDAISDIGRIHPSDNVRELAGEVLTLLREDWS